MLPDSVAINIAIFVFKAFFCIAASNERICLDNLHGLGEFLLILVGNPQQIGVKGCCR